MNKIMLLSLVTGFVVTMPPRVNALNLPEISQNFHGKTNVLLAQDRRHRERRQYFVYYRAPQDSKWTLEGPHPDRQEARRVAHRLERRGFRTDLRVIVDINRRGDRGRDR